LRATDIAKRLRYRKPSILGEQNFSKYAILLPLIEKKDETHILFEVRSMNLRNQPGDICFPGGKIDQSDRTAKHTAIRETSEELGIPATHIYDIIPLDYIVSHFGRIIYPYMGRVINYGQMSPNPYEVQEIFTVPLSYFLQTEPKAYKVDFQVLPEKNFPYDLIIGGKNYDWQTRHINELFYEYGDKVIWGLTAKILTHFITLLSNKNKDI